MPIITNLKTIVDTAVQDNTNFQDKINNIQVQIDDAANDAKQDYNVNHTTLLDEYNTNNTLKLEQYNYNHVERLDDLNYAYADRILDMINTKKLIGVVDQFNAMEPTQYAMFLDTVGTSYNYYLNSVLMVEGVDYMVINNQEIEIPAGIDAHDVILQIDTNLLESLLVSSGYVHTDTIGVANGIAALDGNGQVPSSQLPSYVDDVIEVATYANLPVTGEKGKIYIVVADETYGNDTSSYRWTGTVYALVSNAFTAVTNTAQNGEVLYYDANAELWRTRANNAPLESGYYNRTDSVMTFDELTRTFTISPVGASFTYTMEGENVIIDAPKSVVLSDIEGEHFIYFNDIEGTIVETTVFDPAIIYKYAFTASIYWDATNKKLVVLGEERHGNIMDYETHTRLHLADGTVYISGLGVSNPTSNTLSSSAGIIRDEDIQLDIDVQSSFYTMYKEGSTGTWRKSTTASANGTTTGLAGRVNYNEFTGTTWQVTEANNINDFVNYILFATNDIRDGHKVVSIMGQGIYNSLIEARDAIGSELGSLSTTGMAFQEFVPMAVVTLRTNGTIEEMTDIRSIKGIATGSFSNHEGLGGLLGGNANGHYHLTNVELAWLQDTLLTKEW